MLGIHGLDPLGAVHGAFGLLAVGLGLPVVLQVKGTRRHRRIGQLYAAAMLGLNITAFLIYDLFGHFGPFHVLAIVSLGSIVAGVTCVRLRRPAVHWYEMHLRFMSWSYAGVVGALVAEVLTRLPGVGLLWGVLVPMGAMSVVTHLLLERRMAASR
jgi:uncharacterized membrane protein